jgi:hypothetical protein
LLEVGSKWLINLKQGKVLHSTGALLREWPRWYSERSGYSYKYIGGDATYVIIPNEVMEQDCLLKFTGEGYYPASLAEPLSCVIGAMHANYHTTPGSYKHKMEIVDGGKYGYSCGCRSNGLAAITMCSIVKTINHHCW